MISRYGRDTNRKLRYRGLSDFKLVCDTCPGPPIYPEGHGEDICLSLDRHMTSLTKRQDICMLEISRGECSSRLGSIDADDTTDKTENNLLVNIGQRLPVSQSKGKAQRDGVITR